MIDCPWLKAFLVRAGNFTLHRIARVPMHDVVFAFSRAAPSMKSQSSPTAASATASSCL
jgi:hypothetical protein